MRLFYKIAYLLLLNYWYIFRPHYHGVHCLITCGRQVLLIRHTYGLDYWEVPGGGFHPGETPLQVAIREVKEEVGLTPAKFTFLGKYTALHEYKTDVVDAFWATVPQTKFALTSPEIAQAKWFPIKSLQTGLRLVSRPILLSPHVQNILELYQNR